MTRRERFLRLVPTKSLEARASSPRWRGWWADIWLELWRRADEAADQEADEVVGPWRCAPPPGMV